MQQSSIQKMTKQKINKGVPVGYKHNWTYRGHWKEIKIKPGQWKITFNATKKTRAGKGGPPKGFKILWGFKNVRQRAIKTGKGKYQTRLTGIKYVIKKKKVKKIGKY